MPLKTAGLLPYRFGSDGTLEVLVVHPGGPLWANKDDGVWSIAKGEYGPDEDAQAAAEREFSEELGQPAPAGPRIDLGELRQPSGKKSTRGLSRAISTRRESTATTSRWNGPPALATRPSGPRSTVPHGCRWQNPNASSSLAKRDSLTDSSSTFARQAGGTTRTRWRGVV